MDASGRSSLPALAHHPRVAMLSLAIPVPDNAQWVETRFCHIHTVAGDKLLAFTIQTILQFISLKQTYYNNKN
jgi:hypothetical protein